MIQTLGAVAGVVGAIVGVPVGVYGLNEKIEAPDYATAVGLVMDGLSKIEKNTTENLELENLNEEDGVIESNEEDNSIKKEQKPEKTKIKRESFLDKLTKNLQDFLDNAE